MTKKEGSNTLDLNIKDVNWNQLNVLVTDEDGTPKRKSMKERLKKEFSVNRAMLPIKAALFMYVGGVTSFLPYLTLHMKEIGLTMEEIAIIYAFLPLASILGPTVSGILADKFGRYTLVLNFNVLMTALFHSLLLIVPHASSNAFSLDCAEEKYFLQWEKCSKDINFVNESHSLILEKCSYACEDSLTEFRLCFTTAANASFVCVENEVQGHTITIDGHLSKINYDNCSQSWLDLHYEDKRYDGIRCPNPCPIKCAIRNEIERNSPSKMTFWFYFILRVIATMMMSSCWSMLDAVVLAKIKEAGGDFGKQRIMTMMSQSMLPLLAGVLVDYFNSSRKTNINYSPVFYIGDCLLIATILILCTLELEITPSEENIMNNIIKLMSKIEIDIFLLIITFLGMNWGFLETYLFLYLKDLQAPTFLLGLTLTVGCASGLPAMFWADYIVEKVGRGLVFFLSFIAYFIRFVGYSYIWNPWYCFPFEILEVITYQIMWVAAATYCPILAPSSLLATMTGIAGAAHYSLGRGLGSFLGGYVISYYGLRDTFRGFGYAALVGGVVYIIVHKMVLQTRIQEREKVLKIGESQGENIKGSRNSMEIIAMMQSSSRRSSYAV